MTEKKVLVIEDDAVLQKALKEKIESIGLTVIVAKEGESGLKKAEAGKPDIILLDIIMPKKNGVEVLKELKKDKNLADIPVLILTVVDDKEMIAKCVELGIEGYFIKSDYSLEDIAKKVEKILS